MAHNERESCFNEIKTKQLVRVICILFARARPSAASHSSRKDKAQSTWSADCVRCAEPSKRAHVISRGVHFGYILHFFPKEDPKLVYKSSLLHSVTPQNSFACAAHFSALSAHFVRYKLSAFDAIPKRIYSFNSVRFALKWLRRACG